MSTHLSYELLIAAQRAALTSLRAQAERRRVQHDGDIRILWTGGMSVARIAAKIDASEWFVRGRIEALGLPKRPPGWRRAHVGLSPAQMEVYRFYRGHDYPAAEARALALGEGR